MRTIKIGTIKGRHNMPVDGYIFNDAEVDPFDFIGMRGVICDWIDKNITFKSVTFAGHDNYDTEFAVSEPVSEEVVDLYITGLTTVTLAIVNEFKNRGVKFSAFHFDRDTNEYVEQGMPVIRHNMFCVG